MSDYPYSPPSGRNPIRRRVQTIETPELRRAQKRFNVELLGQAAVSAVAAGGLLYILWSVFVSGAAGS